MIRMLFFVGALLFTQNALGSESDDDVSLGERALKTRLGSATLEQPVSMVWQDCEGSGHSASLSRARLIQQAQDAPASTGRPSARQEMMQRHCESSE